MERPEFDITIGKDGKVTVEVKGTSGKRCLELADLIKEIVGREDKRTLTTDYYAQDGKVRINTKVNQG
ncbi:MAG: DUF2997 domain-containing protein [Phycisphaerales bacterium]|nr:DUF2997 domain-containing protein [Phycisphaerales bacterium]